MSPLRSVSLIFVLLYTFSSIQSVQAQGTANRKCYMCSGKYECEKGQSVVQECSYNGSICFKTYGKGLLPETASRGCATFTPKLAAEDLKCKEIITAKEGGQYTEIVCRCDTDECNSMANDKPGEGGESSGSNMRVFSLWPLAALTPLLCSSILG